jgi:hypothetical protein
MAPSTALEADLFCWSILSRQALTLLTSCATTSTGEYGVNHCTHVPAGFTSSIAYLNETT